MISGVVNSDLQATVAIVAQDANEVEHQITTVIDTGFNGYLTLPSAIWSCHGSVDSSAFSATAT